MEWLLSVIIGTVILIGACIYLTCSSAWIFGGKFYINENGGRRKTWIERLADGFEALRSM